MRKTLPWVIEAGRVVNDPKYGTPPYSGPNGAFEVGELRIIANKACRESSYWEHVSVSLADRTPTWEEMAKVKEWFWEDDELVIQFHPRKKDYVNCHPYCLHLWRHIHKIIPTPPTNLVGPKT